MREAGSADGLSPEQVRILVYLGRASPGEATVTDLAKTFLVGHATVSASVGRLVERGLVERVPVGPGRKSRLELTGDGAEAAGRAARCSATFEDAVGGLDARAKPAFLHALLTVLGHVQDAAGMEPTRLCLNCNHFSPVEEEPAAAPYKCEDHGEAMATGSLRLQCPDFDTAEGGRRARNWDLVLTDLRSAT